MSETTHEIKMAQAVTRWVKGVKERAQHRTRVSGSDCNTSDAEYVAAHIERQAERIAELEAEAAEWKSKYQSNEACINMAIARMAGTVEGRSTQRINFLQRIDALRELECDPRVVRLMKPEHRDRVMREAAELVGREYTEMILDEDAVEDWGGHQ